MATKVKPMPRARLVKLQIAELSTVDEGAQTKAGSVILKRKLDAAGELVRGQLLETDPPPPTAIEKKSLLTSAEMGHTHLLMGVDDAMAGTTTSERIYATSGDSYSSYHSHPWVRSEDGTILIGEAAGHTHEALNVKPVAKAKETAMLTEKNENEKRLETELTKARAFGELNDEQKTFYGGLSDVAKAAFLGKPVEDRMSDIAKSLAADPVVVELDGVEYRKSAGATTIALAKRAKADGEKLAKREQELEMERLEKRAVKELGNLPKTNIVKAAVLKAIESIPDVEVRKDALEMLSAANEGQAEIYKSAGHAGKPAPGSAKDAWEQGLTAFAKSKSIDPISATESFLETEDGSRLAEAMDEERDGN